MRYFTIKEVSQITGLPPHTLRFWEKEFMDVLAPDRSKGGQRRYTNENLSVIESIKRFKEQGMRLTHIKEKISDHSDENRSVPEGIDLFAKKVAEMVSNEIYEFLKRDTIDADSTK